MCFRQEKTKVMATIHDRHTRPYPPSGTRVSIRDKAGDLAFYLRGIVDKVTKLRVCFRPGTVDCLSIKDGRKEKFHNTSWTKCDSFEMMVFDSVDDLGWGWSELEDVDKDNGDTTLVNFGGTDFSGYFLSELLSDFKILCEDVTFSCHKIVLATGSPVFEAAVNSNMLEAKSGCLKIEDCKPNVVKFILEFIYKSQVDIKTLKEDPVFAREVLVAAEKYRLEKLKDLAEKELCTQIGIENALELLVVGDMYGAAKLRKSAKELIIKKKNDIVNLNKDEFRQFIRNYPDLSFEILELL